MTENEKPLIMVVGCGDLAARVLTLLLNTPDTNRVVLAGRDLEKATRTANLAMLTAANLGVLGDVRVERVDLDDVAATAETIAAVRPDIVFMAASLQSWRIITKLPKADFEALDEAQLGPWLPMHLAPNYLLAQAIRESGTAPKVVNAAYPDAVGPVLAKAGMAPTTGIGNVGNIIPALTFGHAIEAGADPSAVEVKLVTQHYFSHYVPRFGDEGNGAYHLSATVHGEPLEGISHRAVFAHLSGRLRRLGGDAGQLLTASSAMRVLHAMATDSGVLAHAPAPNGLPGGYPVRVGRDGVTPDLPGDMPMDTAIAINEDCQRADGIDHIDEDGTVTFTDREMAVMRRLLGYECRTMRLVDTGVWADELAGRYRKFAEQAAA
ncbi:hypothetical protein [Amycolatopsis minnesotensis]|uniref:Saccharopine dehydrogenase NADP binding domain-containing protein n=1 Tax=Amycolatopsis minnesotensis TaxID=337894 RepID=A0ABN2RSK1_9PSEU